MIDLIIHSMVWVDEPSSGVSVFQVDISNVNNSSKAMEEKIKAMQRK